MVNLEIELNQFKDQAGSRIDQNEIDEQFAKNIEMNAQRMQQMHEKHNEEIKSLKDVILQLEDHISSLQTQKGEADQKLIISQNNNEDNKKELKSLKQQLTKQKEAEDSLKKELAKSPKRDM